MRWSVALRVVTVTTCLAGGIAESCDGLGMLQIEKAPEVNDESRNGETGCDGKLVETGYNQFEEFWR